MLIIQAEKQNPTVNGFLIRPPELTDTDAESVAEVLNGYAEKYLGTRAVLASDLFAQWQEPSFNLATNAWVAETRERRIVGYIRVRDPYTSARLWGRVHPEFGGKSIGSLLIRTAESRVQKMIPTIQPGLQVAMFNQVIHHDPKAAELLLQEGFEVVRHFWYMETTMNTAPSMPEIPKGITIRAFTADQQSEALHRLVNEVFADHWGWNAMSFDVWQHTIAAPSPLFDPSLWFLAMDGEKIAGFAICNPYLSVPDLGHWPHKGYINMMGTHPEYRRRGISSALMMQALNGFYKRGQRTVTLVVDRQNPNRAYEIYQRAGMKPVMQLDMYKKLLRDGPLPLNERV